MATPTGWDWASTSPLIRSGTPPAPGFGLGVGDPAVAMCAGVAGCFATAAVAGGCGGWLVTAAHTMTAPTSPTITAATAAMSRWA
jgi:hypothetical protein